MMESSIWRVCLFLFFICSFPQSSPIFAQFNDTQFEQIGIEQGLSNQKVNDILQDKNGFLWIATDNGLNKYDGYNFKVYKNVPDDPFSIRHNKINAICDSEIYGGSSTQPRQGSPTITSLPLKRLNRMSGSGPKEEG